MSMSIELFQGEKRTFKTSPGSCREETYRKMMGELQAQKIGQEILDLPTTKVVFDIYLTAPTSTADYMYKWLQFFTRRLLKRVAEAYGYKDSLAIKLEKTSNGHVSNTRVTMPAFVLNNPYFISFYIGCARSVASYMAVSEAHSKEISAMKTYTEALKKTISESNAGYTPQSGDLAAKTRALLGSYKKGTCLADIFKKEETSAYKGTFGQTGFNHWYQEEGDKFAALMTPRVKKPAVKGFSKLKQST